MATEAQKRELREKLDSLVENKFGGSRRAAFDYYDTDADGTVDKAELKAMLSEAGVGNSLTRWAWANGITEELDKNGDGRISWDEFISVME